MRLCHGKRLGLELAVSSSHAQIRHLRFALIVSTVLKVTPRCAQLTRSADVDENSPGPDFDKAFTPAILDAIVRAHAVAYNDAAERHDPAVGSNATTFGVGVYNYAWHRLRDTSKSHPTMSVTKDNGADRLHVGAFVLGSHRVGSSADADIDHSFPNNDGATTTMIEGHQQYLPGMEPKAEDFADRRRFVIAHLGNPEDGLCALYLCIPEGRYGEKIERWAHTRLIWKRSEIRDELPPPTIESKPATLPTRPRPAAVKPPPENIIDFEVHRRRKRKTDGEPTSE